MEEENFDVIANDGLILQGRAWIPKQPKAMLCLVHGMGEHCRRYNNIITFLLSKNFAIFSYDQRGHGESAGKRGHFKSYTLLLEDVENILKKARCEFPDLPLFLYGHSWGGNIVANFILKRKSKEISGVILSAPWFRLNIYPNQLKVYLAKTIYKISPSVLTDNQIAADLLSKDPEVVKNYKNDPLVHPYISLNAYFQTEKAGNWALENASKINMPALLIHGAADEITSKEASQEFAEIAGNKAEIKIWKNVKHEPHNDLEKNEIFEFIFNWIQSKITHYSPKEKI
ncbi:alpha/beta hydrolase [soil metagenome]